MKKKENGILQEINKVKEKFLISKYITIKQVH